MSNETLAAKEKFKFQLRCVRIIDTRARDAAGKPVPGTGHDVPCACCGRAVEVHAIVRYRSVVKRETETPGCPVWVTLENNVKEEIWGRSCVKKHEGCCNFWWRNP